jgi:tetratricopeptide (TPR) repeat protein
VNLAEAHQNLGETDQVLELLDHAERYASAGSWDHISFIALRRAEALLAAKRPEEAGALCRQVIEGKHEPPRAIRLYAALYTLGKAEEQCGRYESAKEFYNRAIDVATKDFPQQISTAQVGVAGTLYALGRYDEATEVLDRFAANAASFPSHEAKALRLRARIAEARNDLRTVIDCERKAVDIEKDLLERKAEQSLRNARIMLETDLLEREAELERERRRRLERELATAVAALGDHTRQAAAIEERLRRALARSAGSSERVVTAALHEALISLRNGKHPKESVHHYLSKVDEDFQQRLRERYSNLTRKQERLCGLIRAGLDYKEIASLLDLQPEGLKALRKRLRKRLGLDQEEPLEKFLADI